MFWSLTCVESASTWASVPSFIDYILLKHAILRQILFIRVDDAKKMHYAFPLETSKNSDMFNYLNDCCEFLKMNKNRVHRVLIVADKNLSRGPTLAMAYLIKEGNMTLKEAWAYMKNVYLAMRPNWHCLEQLALFEKTVKGLPEATPIVDEDFK
ncbi:hypothetical protein AAHC03_04673 [Spirometra sp. Aus1]